MHGVDLGRVLLLPNGHRRLTVQPFAREFDAGVHASGDRSRSAWAAAFVLAGMVDDDDGHAGAMSDRVQMLEEDAEVPRRILVHAWSAAVHGINDKRDER